MTICVKLLRFALCVTFWEMLRFAVHVFTSSRHNLPWFTKNLKKLCKRKQRWYNKENKTRNQDDWQEFCDIRTNVHKQLCSARVSHISQFLTTSITDKPKSSWTFISKLRQDNQGIGDLHVSGYIVSDDVLKAEALNKQLHTEYIQKKGVSHCQIWVKVHMGKLKGCTFQSVVY